ncbi:hypothetical protein JS55_02450 [Rickettsia felis str. LSU]|nr:hypothetical protein JS55_02450 [Rickettsia felis str. LSU]
MAQKNALGVIPCKGYVTFTIAWTGNALYVIPAKAGIQKKKHTYNKFLKLKARFISLYDGFLLSQE